MLISVLGWCMNSKEKKSGTVGSLPGEIESDSSQGSGSDSDFSGGGGDSGGGGSSDSW